MVLALEEAAASTSVNLVVSFAVIPNAVSASVTMSEVEARLSPDAPASVMTPWMPFNISFVFQPAIAMYW